MCRRLLDLPGDPMSVDCGGDCLGCVRECETGEAGPRSNPAVFDGVRIDAFGRDCLGNISGYCVVAGFGTRRRNLAVFYGDIYVPGSFEKAMESAMAALIGFSSI